ncbi:hypothetical protein SAMN05216203_2029 [Marinobacter daqiaonensis]|uniref:Uncharacterized protein n=1 Tax=Marinobacter daqiaonensis TaxID=650891 RepID=A0A1I6IA70_9GAMM|nr:hypothetical protein [Marinobacter daqiaonensis]SFR63655.1 hypothetical protein SAMN05216203_2029 [Marinobacter daqiaonensis]
MGEGKDPTVKEFFEDFGAAFSSFDGDRVATKFSLPYMAKGPGDVCNVFNSRSQLAEYFQSYVHVKLSAAYLAKMVVRAALL